ncbi:restriction endonuclease subunit S [Haemophilus parahaemolyticus]|uniref:restriction endonuclease subunit S n=1 Tax=Haemophilus parahaemolyticus TaxID=735 RepID=UPI0031EF5E2D
MFLPFIFNTITWEQRKLGELGYTFNGLNGKSKDDFGHGSAKYITYMNVYKNPIATLEELDLIEIDKSQNEIKKGDILFTTSSETPEEVGLSSVWMYEITNIYLNSFCFGFRLEQKISINYMAYMLRSNSIRNKITLLAQGISRYNISKKGMMNIEVFLPSYAEQTQIGNFFKQLDDTIALHQRELEKFKILKTSYLENIFLGKVSLFTAKNTITWEQRKLGEVVNVLDNLRIPIAASQRLEGVTPYYGANGIQGYIDGFTHDGEFVLVAEDGANDLINYPVQYVLGKVWINNHAHVLQGIKNVANNLFLVYRIKSMDMTKYLVGGGRTKLNASVMKDIELHLPNYAEQTQIGNFFKQLDDTITLHQKELAKYQQIKAACLEKMFVE